MIHFFKNKFVNPTDHKSFNCSVCSHLIFVKLSPVKELHAQYEFMWQHEPYSSILLVSIIFVSLKIYSIQCALCSTQ